jgi:hypothetical protein
MYLMLELRGIYGGYSIDCVNGFLPPSAFCTSIDTTYNGLGRIRLCVMSILFQHSFSEAISMVGKLLLAYTVGSCCLIVRMSG